MGHRRVDWFIPTWYSRLSRLQQYNSGRWAAPRLSAWCFPLTGQQVQSYHLDVYLPIHQRIDISFLHTALHCTFCPLRRSSLVWTNMSYTFISTCIEEGIVPCHALLLLTRHRLCQRAANLDGRTVCVMPLPLPLLVPGFGSHEEVVMSTPLSQGPLDSKPDTCLETDI